MRGRGWRDYESVCGFSGAKCWLIDKCRGEDCIYVGDDVVQLDSGVFGVNRSGEIIQGHDRFGSRVIMHGFRQTIERGQRREVKELDGTPWGL